MSASGIRTVRVVGTVLALLMVLTAALSATAQAARHSETTSHDLSPDLTALEVRTDVGNVQVTAIGAGEEPRAFVTATGGFAEPTVELALGEDAASLTGDCPSGIWFGPCEVDWEIAVPADTAVTVHSSVGAVTVEGMAGDVTVAADVGEVTVADVTARTLDLRSAVGDVVVDLAAAPDALTARTDTGGIRVTVPDDGTPYRVRAETSLGEVRTRVPVDNTSDHDLDLLTSLGDVAVRPG